MAEATALGYRTRRFVVLGNDFDCLLADDTLRNRVDQLFDPFAANGRASTSYVLIDDGPGFRLYHQGKLLAHGESADELVDWLVWHVNHRTVSASPDYLILHASAAARDGRAILLAGPTGSGKTTLVAGLVSAGLDYLTDELVALNPVSGLVRAVPKALAVKEGSRGLLLALQPHLEADAPSDSRRPWHVDPRAIRPDSISRLAAPCLVVFPRYEPDSEMRLGSLTAAEGMLRLSENAFNLEVHGRIGLEVLRKVVEMAPSFELVTCDFVAACRVLTGLLESATPCQPLTAAETPDRAPIGTRRLDGNAIFRARGSVESATRSGEVALLDRLTDSVHVLNHSATAVWTRLDGASTIDALVHRLGREFEVLPGQMRADVEAVVSHLLDLRLVEAVCAGAA